MVALEATERGRATYRQPSRRPSRDRGGRRDRPVSLPARPSRSRARSSCSRATSPRAAEHGHAARQRALDAFSAEAAADGSRPDRELMLPAREDGARGRPRPLCSRSCHVERPLDDAVWSVFSRAPDRRPRGFRHRRASAAAPTLERGRDALARARAGSPRPAPLRAPHALGRRRPGPAARRRPAGAVIGERLPGCATAGSRRACSAAAAGTSTRRSPPPRRARLHDCSAPRSGPIPARRRAQASAAEPAWLRLGGANCSSCRRRTRSGCPRAHRSAAACRASCTSTSTTPI